MGDAVELEANRAVGRAAEITMPGEIDFAAPVFGVKPDRKRLRGRVDNEVFHREGERAPVPIAHGGVNATKRLDRAQADISQVGVVENHCQRPGPQRARRCGSCGMPAYKWFQC
ncbi:MAG: hypothetical protein ACT4QC_17885 [Planctomycetaceae bacterium]